MKSQNVTIIVGDNKSSGKINVDKNIIYLDFGITKQVIDFNDIKAIDKNENNSINIVLSDNSMINLRFKEYLVLYKMVDEYIEEKKKKEGKKCPECGEINDNNSNICTNCGFPFKKKVNIMSYIRIVLIAFIILGIAFIEYKSNFLERLLQINYTDSKCFKVKNGVIKDYDTKCTKKVIIPYMINHRLITEIGDKAFINANIESVKLPKYIRIIGKESFSGNKLKKIEFPKSVKKIKSSAFLDNNLKSVKFNDNLKVIDSYAFNSNYIEELVVTDSVEKIGERSFANNNLKKIIIGSNITKIENEAFAQDEYKYYAGDDEHNQKLSEIINKSGNKFEWYGILGFGGYKDAPELWLDKGEVKTKFGTIVIKN